jgi:membrane fusion protein (multidrug efflux system)
MQSGPQMQRGAPRLEEKSLGSQPEWKNRKRGKAPTLLGLLACVLLPLVACEKKEKPPEARPPEVEVTEVVQHDVPIYGEWVAQLNGKNNADITPKVQGYLLRQNYPNGRFVKKGQLLYQIDPRPSQASLDQAKSQVAVAVANLTEAENNVARDTPLAAQNAIPQKQLDTDRSTLAASKAQLDAAKAQMVQAELNLAWCNVYSPIDGIAGVSNSQVGDLVGNSTKMTTVSEVNPIWAYFNISESDYLANAQRISQVVRGRADPAGRAPIEFIQANSITYPEIGHIILVSRQINSQTGTIQLAGEFPNKDAFLRPGGFGRVRIETGNTKNALLVPQAAVIEVQSMYQVVVIGPDNKATFRAVKVGERVGKDWVITEGLKPGEKVVVQGFMKVREGTPVTTKPYAIATAAAAGD